MYYLKRKAYQSVRFAEVNLTRLRYFLMVAEELHFSRAAERLHMAQPPLSQQIRELERELGMRLFERTTRRVTLTEAGRMLQVEGRRLVRDADGLTRRMNGLRLGEAGVLRLAFVDSASYSVMPKLVRSHRSRWPMMTYELTSMSSDQQHAALAAGQIDVGIARTAGPSATMRSVTVLNEPLMVAVGPDHRLARQKSTSVRQLAAEAFVGFDRHVSPSLHAELRAFFASEGVTYDPTIEATEYTTVLGLVASGQGIAVVPACVGAFQPAGLRYLDLRHPRAKSSLILVSCKEQGTPLVDHAFATAMESFT